MAFLIFTVEGSGQFQGVATVASLAPVSCCAEFALSVDLIIAYNVNWIKR